VDPGKWKIVFFWPKDFTFVCPTEIAGFGKLNGEFADRDAVRRELGATLGILDKTEGVALRATFIVDPEGVIRSSR
jgi:lipoyl-dependent peroxiredoxin subunit C